MLALAAESPYWNASALTFYGVLVAAVVAGPVAIILQGRVKAAEAEATARREREAEEAKGKRDSDAADAQEAVENAAWLRGQVVALLERAEAADRRDDDRQRQLSKLQSQLQGLRAQLRDRDSDDRARDGRIAQLEAALVSAHISVPPPQADYRELLRREGGRRLPREED